MTRIRSVHPDALKSDKLAACSAEAERCYWRLLPLCDDDGRAEDDPVLIAADAFKKREDIIGALVDEWLAELHDLGLVVRYVVEGHGYLVVTRWSDYQKPQKKVSSKLPPLPEDYESTTRPVAEVRSTELEVGVGDGEGVSLSHRVELAIDLLAKQDAERVENPRNPRAVLNTCRNARLADSKGLLESLAAKEPDWSTVQLADAVDAPLAAVKPRIDLWCGRCQKSGNHYTDEHGMAS